MITVEHEWSHGRCPCCRKKTEIVLGALFNMTARGWNNAMGRTRSVELARQGTCPWCGRETTIVARTLISRFEPTLMSISRETGL